MFQVQGQEKFAKLFGKITDVKGTPISDVNISIVGYSSGTVSNEKGEYELKIIADKDIEIGFLYIGFETKKVAMNVKFGEKVEHNEQLKVKFSVLDTVTVTSERKNYTTFERIDPRILKDIPNPSGDFSTVLKTLSGVSSSNELSSQYSVRGGSFDENLIYVNDIEIYRPMLIRSGQQEGLSFVNSDMIESILFSAGGFDAKYGDKMSSVLDIKYKKPQEFEAGISASLLGGSVYVGDKIGKLTYISSFRYKTSKYLLNTLETDGTYQPSFNDWQTFLTYQINDKLDINLLLNYSKNTYLFIPEDRKTSFGTVNNALGLKVYFDGEELDKFYTYLGTISSNYKVNKETTLKFIFSSYQTKEKENYDILGQYLLNELDKQIGSNNLGDSILNLGIGSFLNHARNFLDARVFTFEHKGYLHKDEHFFQWGVKAQKEIIIDKMNEWQILDSAGYSLPFSDTQVLLKESINAKNEINSNRFSAYIQDNYKFSLDSVILRLTAGLRANYWDFNNQFLLSPRASLAFEPNWKKKVLFKFAFGFYHQPPFFKELKDLNGKIQKDIKAQESIHLVLTAERNFTHWNRNFKLTSSIYYKFLNHLIPYEIDNVRIRYYGANNSKGYTTGLDFKINGDFVKGVDSWFSLSLMKAREDISGDNEGYMPRPTDQILNVGLFFQDYLLNNQLYKMHLNLVFATGLPFNAPNIKTLDATNRIPAYRRVDIGFSKVIKSESDNYSPNNPFRFIKNIWLTGEVFNLLNINNTVSYTWIKVVPNATNPYPNFPDQFAIPNYLTTRRLNLKLTVKF